MGRAIEQWHCRAGRARQADHYFNFGRHGRYCRPAADASLADKAPTLQPIVRSSTFSQLVVPSFCNSGSE